MPRARDLTGQRFGRLVVERLGPHRIRGKRRVPFKTWWCKCDCGAAKLVDMGNLVRGTTVSCGCYGREVNRLPPTQRRRDAAKKRYAQMYDSLIGRTFGELTVLRRAVLPSGKGAWECRCACGGFLMTQTNHLTSGNTKSCGCQKYRGLPKIISMRRAARIPDHLRKSYVNRRLRGGVAVLADWYVRARVRDEYAVYRASDIPEQVVEAKRVQIQLKRLIEEKQNGTQ